MRFESSADASMSLVVCRFAWKTKQSYVSAELPGLYSFYWGVEVLEYIQSAAIAAADVGRADFPTAGDFNYECMYQCDLDSGCAGIALRNGVWPTYGSCARIMTTGYTVGLQRMLTRTQYVSLRNFVGAFS